MGGTAHEAVAKRRKEALEACLAALLLVGLVLVVALAADHTSAVRVGVGTLVLPLALNTWMLWRSKVEQADDLSKWHRALDKIQVLPILWAGLVALSVALQQAGEFPEALRGPLTSLLSLGAIFHSLNDIRPDLHEATKDRLR